MKRAKTTFFGPDNLTVVEGSLFDDKSPVVRNWPDLFEDAEVARDRTAATPPTFGPADFAHLVEDATARPGRRSSKRAVADAVADETPAEGAEA